VWDNMMSHHSVFGAAPHGTRQRLKASALKIHTAGPSPEERLPRPDDSRSPRFIAIAFHLKIQYTFDYASLRRSPVIERI